MFFSRAAGSGSDLQWFVGNLLHKETHASLRACEVRGQCVNQSAVYQSVPSLRSYSYRLRFVSAVLSGFPWCSVARSISDACSAKPIKDICWLDVCMCVFLQAEVQKWSSGAAGLKHAVAGLVAVFHGAADGRSCFPRRHRANQYFTRQLWVTASHLLTVSRLVLIPPSFSHSGSVKCDSGGQRNC